VVTIFEILTFFLWYCAQVGLPFVMCLVSKGPPVD